MVILIFFFDILMKKKIKIIKMVLECVDIYFSVIFWLNLRIFVIVVVIIEVMVFDLDLCVIDIVIIVKYGEIKKFCVDIIGYFNFKIYWNYY